MIATISATAAAADDDDVIAFNEKIHNVLNDLRRNGQLLKEGTKDNCSCINPVI